MSLRSKPPTRFARKTILLRLKQPARRASRPRQHSPSFMSLRSKIANEIRPQNDPSAPEATGSARKSASPAFPLVYVASLQTANEIRPQNDPSAPEATGSARKSASPANSLLSNGADRG